MKAALKKQMGKDTHWEVGSTILARGLNVYPKIGGGKGTLHDCSVFTKVGPDDWHDEMGDPHTFNGMLSRHLWQVVDTVEVVTATDVIYDA